MNNEYRSAKKYLLLHIYSCVQYNSSVLHLKAKFKIKLKLIYFKFMNLKLKFIALSANWYVLGQTLSELLSVFFLSELIPFVDFLRINCCPSVAYE